MVLLPNINRTSTRNPGELRQTVRASRFRFRDARVEITISIGAHLFRPGDHTTDVFGAPDKALYSSSTRAGIKVNLA